MIGCIGYGFVGSALCKTFSKKTNVAVYDIIDVSEKMSDKMVFFNDFEKFVDAVEKNTTTTPIYFICVPTPMLKTEKKCDTRIIDSVILKLSEKINKRSAVIIKSTIPLGKTDMYNSLFCTKLDVIFNPEFLTQINAEEDFRNQNRTILGTELGKDDHIIQEISDLYHKTIEGIDIQICFPREAEMTKLMLNNYWAVKVAFANEMYDICKKSNIDYKTVSHLVKGDDRMGKTHLSVPGSDGLRGFGGVCLPKDLNNLKTYANSMGIETIILDAAWKKNCEVREEFDWENLIGKAVSD